MLIAGISEHGEKVALQALHGIEVHGGTVFSAGYADNGLLHDDSLIRTGRLQRDVRSHALVVPVPSAFARFARAAPAVS